MKKHTKEHVVMDYCDITATLSQIEAALCIAMDYLEGEVDGIKETLNGMGRGNMIRPIETSMLAIHMVWSGLYDLLKECEVSEQEA